MGKRTLPHGAKPAPSLPGHLVHLGERGVYSTKNRLNDLTGREWLFATKSVINKSYPPSFQHRLRSQHGGQKPPELCRDLIRFFTKPGQRVLDPFMGVGGTLLGATIAERSALGIEISPCWVDVYHEVCRLEGLPTEETIVGDARQVLPMIEDESFDFVLTDVPYWHMDTARRSKGRYKRAGEPAKPYRAPKLSPFTQQCDADKAAWLTLVRDVLLESRRKLKPRGYMAIFIGDMYHGGRYHFLSADVAGALDGRGLTLKADLVWYDVAKKLHIYGYQYEFVPSMIHQNILVFRREA